MAKKIRQPPDNAGAAGTAYQKNKQKIKDQTPTVPEPARKKIRKKISWWTRLYKKVHKRKNKEGKDLARDDSTSRQFILPYLILFSFSFIFLVLLALTRKY